MAVTGIGSNYNAYESAYAAQKNETAKKTEVKEQQAAQTGNEKSSTSRTTTDYNSYLQKNYDCVKNGNVSISGAYLRKCASDPEKAKTLEDNLSLYNELYDRSYKSAQKAAAAYGGTVTNYSITWNVDENGNISMMGSSTVITESPNKSKGSGQADWLKKLQEKKKEEQLAEKKRAEKKQAKREQEERLAEMRAERKAEGENLQSYEFKVVGKDVRDLTEKMIAAMKNPNSAAVSATAGLDLKI